MVLVTPYKDLYHTLQFRSKSHLTKICYPACTTLISDQPPGLKEPLGKAFRRTDRGTGRGRDAIMFTAGPGLRVEGTGTTHLAETAAIVHTAVQEWVQWELAGRSERSLTAKPFLSPLRPVRLSARGFVESQVAVLSTGGACVRCEPLERIPQPVLRLRLAVVGPTP